MTTHADQQSIRVLVADDDEHVLECYRDAFNDDSMRFRQSCSNP